MSYSVTMDLLLISVLILLFLLLMTMREKKRSVLQSVSLSINGLLLLWTISTIFEEYYRYTFNKTNMLFVNLCYVGICFLPPLILLLGLSFSKTIIRFNSKYLLLFIVPVVTTIVIWTNQYHDLFFVHYSTCSNEAIYGAYYFFHSLYSYGLIFIGVYYLMSYSVRNAGLFSRQSLLLTFAIIIPVIINIAYSFNLMELTFNINPIAFTIWAFLSLIAIRKFNFLKAIPIALQRVVDCISDSYFVINNEFEVVDFNNSFKKKILNGETIEKGKTTFKNLVEKNIFAESEYNLIMRKIEKESTEETSNFELEVDRIKKVFSTEVDPIVNNNKQLGTIVLFKDITELKQTQQILIEQERLSSLGQLIGGIAHNLKTPIMSIAGSLEGITDLIKEYDESIDDPEVTKEDHHEIAGEMKEWIGKIRPYLSYMTEVIDAVKGQAVSMNASTMESFSARELILRTQILMKDELKRRHSRLNLDLSINEGSQIKGEIGAIVQVMDNLIINAMDAYGENGGDINVRVKEDTDKVYIEIEDFAGGIAPHIKEKLFKEMITSKGKNGTGLGLYMCYSTIKGKFNGDMRFESEEGKGTTFFIELNKK